MVGWESGVRCGRRNRSGLLIKCRARYARGRGSSTRQLQAPVRVRTRAHPKRDTKTRGLRRSVRSQMNRHLVGRIRGVPTAAPMPEPSVSAVRASLTHPRISFKGPSAEPVSPCHPKLFSLTQGRRGTDFWPQPPAMFSLSPPRTLWDAKCRLRLLACFFPFIAFIVLKEARRIIERGYDVILRRRLWCASNFGWKHHVKHSCLLIG